MSRGQQSRFAVGLILVLLGGFLLAVQFFPGLNDWIDARFEWPVWMIGGGAVLLIIGLLAGTPGLAVPASILAGIGGILYWQVVSDDFASWSYMWALIPGFVGVGTLIMGLISKQERSGITGGLQLIAISLVMFAVFGSLFGSLSGVVQYWPVLLIIYGVVILVRMILKRS